MKKKIVVAVPLMLIFVTFLTATVLYADTIVFPFEQETTLSDPCAVFNDQISSTVTRIVYGETVDFDLTGTVQAIIDVGDDGQTNLKFMINTHGNGIGETSNMKYVFNSKLLAKANTNGANPTDPDFVFDGKFKLTARVIAQGSTGENSATIAQGAQDNASLDFIVAVHYANSEIQSAASDFDLQCVASPWADLMERPEAGNKRSDGVGRGWGDPWNKYAWSMKDYKGGMIVGTKNAFFDYNAILNPTADVNTCMTLAYPQLAIYAPLFCLELYDAGSGAQTNYADIWRYDYVKKNWTNVYHDGESQGFRVMTTYNGDLYVGSDLGAFISGVDLLGGSSWDFPGSQILKSSDGKNFSTLDCTGGPCESASVSWTPGNVGADLLTLENTDENISFRALAAYAGKLYVGTFNFTGGELWSYDDEDGWYLVHKFPVTKPGVSELQVYDGELYIGLFGYPSDDYLYRYDGATLEPVPDQPNLTTYYGDGGDIGVLKLFVSSDDLLYIGNVDLLNGFYLQTYDGSDFNTITDNGFFNSSNAYDWSMAEINGRIFLGTFDDNFLTSLPRGSAELWYSDDGENWQQMALPLDWGLWNYGIRVMDVGNRMLFLGSASNMIAPDLISQPIPLSPGAEVWTIRDTVVAPTGKGRKKNK